MNTCSCSFVKGSVLFFMILLAACGEGGTTPNALTTNTSIASTIQSSTVSTAGATISQCQGDTSAPIPSSQWKLAWLRSFDNSVARPPQISGNQILVIERADPYPQTIKDTLWILDPATGKDQWHYNTIGTLTAPSSWLIKDSAWSTKYIALQIRRMINGKPESQVLVFDRLSGESIYSDSLQTQALALSDDALYYRGGDRQTHAVDLPSKELRWSDQRAYLPFYGMFALNDWLYQFVWDQDTPMVYRYNAQSGVVEAGGKLGIEPAAGNLLFRGELALARSKQAVLLFELQSFTVKWKTNVSFLPVRMSNAFWGDSPSATIDRDAVYLFDGSDHLSKINLSDGRLLWSISAPETEPMARPAVVDDLVYVLYADGTLRAFAQSDGAEAGIVMRTPLWYWKRTDTEEWRDLLGGLDVAGDTLIITTGCRSVYAIQRNK